MEVKPGYKQTEVGVIPEEWEVKPFAELFAFRNGVNADKAAYGQGVRFINVLEPITYSHIHGPEITGQVTLPEEIVASYAVRRGDMLFNRTSETQEEVALAATYLGTERVVFGGFVIRGRPMAENFDPVYAGYALRAPCIRSQIIPMGQGAVRANVGQQNLGRVLAPLPPLPEQRAIAMALSDVDGLLGGLDRLIAKKRDLKQAAMQQLLTRQTRLPGFHGEWEETTLRELATFLSGGTPSRSNDDYWTGDIPWISASSLRCFEIWRSDSNVTKEAVAAGSKMAPVGSSLLLVRGSALHNEILCGLVTRPVCFNQDVKALVPRSQVVPKFLTLFIRGTAEEFLKLVSSAGNTAGVLDTKLLKAFAINLPSVPEQTAIAEVLTEMDAELAALGQRREKTRALKQAMMQELLTGKTRLIADAEVEVTA